MCKNAEHGTKLPISTKYAVEKRHGAAALAARSTRASVLRFSETAPGQRAWDNSGEL